MNQYSTRKNGNGNFALVQSSRSQKTVGGAAPNGDANPHQVGSEFTIALMQLYYHIITG